MSAIAQGALCVIAVALVSSPAIAQERNFTQCLREKATLPCEQWKVQQDYCRSSKEKLYLDESRGCYGQRWSIPAGFYLTKYVAYKPVTEALILTIGRPGFVDGVTGIVAGRDLPKSVPPLYKEVKVRPLFFGDFEQRKQQTISSYRSTGGLADTGQQLHGLRVFDQTKTQPDQYRDVFLFPARSGQWYARCIVKPGVSFEDGLKSQGGCTVVHNIEDRVYVEFFVRKSELSDLQRINSDVTGLIRTFMVS